MSVTKMDYVNKLISNNFKTIMDNCYCSDFKGIERGEDGKYIIRYYYDDVSRGYYTTSELSELLKVEIKSLNDVIKALGYWDEYKDKFLEIPTMFDQELRSFVIDNEKLDGLFIHLDKVYIINDDNLHPPSDKDILDTLDEIKVSSFIKSDISGYNFKIKTQYFGFTGVITLKDGKYTTEVNGVIPTSYVKVLNLQPYIQNETFLELWMSKLIKAYSKLELPKITPDDVTFI